jgi:hypothetical protein
LIAINIYDQSGNPPNTMEKFLRAAFPGIAAPVAFVCILPKADYLNPV